MEQKDVKDIIINQLQKQVENQQVIIENSIIIINNIIKEYQKIIKVTTISCFTTMVIIIGLIIGFLK